MASPNESAQTSRLTRRPEPTARLLPRDELLSIAEVCEELGIARATFYRRCAQRKGPASLRLPNGTVRIRRSALTASIAACEGAAR